MADVLTAMEGDVEAYRGDGEPQPTTAAADWRRLLDLAPRLGDAAGGDRAVPHVGRPGRRRRLTSSCGSTARQRYDTLVADGDWMGRSARRAPGHGALGVRLPPPSP